jgi:ribosomal protein S18 acetylase RimI-like enzyme
LATVLIPMRRSEFDVYREASIYVYAEENIAAGRWPVEGALERSRLDYATLLPQGLSTPDNFLFEIHNSTANDEASPGIRIGYLWLAIVEQHGVRGGYVYDLEISAEYRRQGHAEAAVRAMELLARDMGLPSIGLHVFANNSGAQTLYAKLGYDVTGHNMIKHLV